MDPPSNLAISLSLATLLPLSYFLYNNVLNPTPPTLEERRSSINKLIQKTTKSLSTTPDSTMTFTSPTDANLQDLLEDILVTSLMNVDSFELSIAPTPSDPYLIIATFSLLPSNSTTNQSADAMTCSAPLLSVLLPAIAAITLPSRSATFLFVADCTNSSLTSLLPSTPLAPLGILPIATSGFLPLLALLHSRSLLSTATVSSAITALVSFTSRSPHREKKTSTLMFDVQGMTAIPDLLPILFDCFPHDRHLFAYASPLTLPPTAPSAPLPPLPLSPTNIEALASRLPLLSLSTHLLVESWLLAVSAFISLKEGSNADTMFKSDMEDERFMSKEERRVRRRAVRAQRGKPEYLPFVLKLGDLTNGDGETRTVCLRILLEFMAGKKSTGVPSGVMESAERALDTFVGGLLADEIRFEGKEREIVEDCVFRDKRVLIHDKTLVDTVKVENDWSLKAARKVTGCACCGPPESDSEDSEKESEGRGKGAGTGAGWSDGSAGFAFDPNMAMKRFGGGGRSGRS